MEPTVIGTERIYALQHLETGEFICLFQDGVDFLACFSDGDTALEFRSALGLQEHVQIYTSLVEKCPFTHFWLDGHNVVIPPRDVPVS
ncbi:MAG: hypothetical protein P4L33_22860 [Capsulimonadaceae bacterium]|nr:hypothetical protein [Capsulimonadaceae bacterium]